ncbi:kinase-regulated stress-responsive transcription factor [Martiniozyma asiatica (nom. inval.)]|nr:kinase-regulated stress-responsive transcription factor [Martiniozyma asiatica]
MEQPSDFANKLFLLLQDPTFFDVVCWSVNGDSFIIKDMPQFSATVLPKYFKHSNFSSFVRQLNKYDFHKVKQNDKKSSAWEFQHPFFNRNHPESLENIKRKIPVKRETVNVEDRVSALEQENLQLTQQFEQQQKSIQTLLHDQMTLRTINDQLTNHLQSLNKLLTNQLGIQVPQLNPHQYSQQQRLMNRPLHSPLHVLLVEDDQVCIQLVQKFLMKYGCTFKLAIDGISAINEVEKCKFDIVLMDIVMPNLDGASATSVIRGFDNDTPIIAMTGNYGREDLVTYLNHGMTDILAKPFSRDDLYAILEKHGNWSLQSVMDDQ